MTQEFRPANWRAFHLICRISFVSPNNIHVQSGDYAGFAVKDGAGNQRTFLKLSPHDDDRDAIEVTEEVKNGRTMAFDR